MHKTESTSERAKLILEELKIKYPAAKSYDLDGRAQHFVCEVEPVTDHPEFDRAVEVIYSSKPHKHLKMTQHYTMLYGTLNLHLDDNEVVLNAGDQYAVLPGTVHWAESKEGAWVEIYSEPGWTKEDHIVVEE